MNDADLVRIDGRDRNRDLQWAVEDRTALLREVRVLRRALRVMLDRHDVGYVLNCKACAAARALLPPEPEEDADDWM